MHTLVAIVSVAIVVGACLYGVHHVMGEYSILAWIVLGWFGLMGVMKAINA